MIKGIGIDIIELPRVQEIITGKQSLLNEF